MFDTVGAGSKDFGRDGRKENGGWEKGARGLRPEGWRDVGLMLSQGSEAERGGRKMETETSEAGEGEALTDGAGGEGAEGPEGGRGTGIFSGLCVYVNGSTAPAIGDHRLKHLLAEHGARVSIALARRSVTHVIVGKANDGRGGGAGGGLAGGKIEREIRRVRGAGVKFVRVEWVVESVRAGRRLSEAGFEGVRVAPGGVGSVYGLFRRGKGGGGEGGAGGAGTKTEREVGDGDGETGG